MEEPYRKYSGDKFETIYNLADQFLEIGKRGFENKNEFEPQPYASIVNLAFSAELFLKYILEDDNNPSWGHKLDKLFDKLKPEDRNTIIVSFIFNYEQKGRVEELKHGKFSEILKAHSELYEGFRYLYDDKNKKMAFRTDKIDFGFVLNLALFAKGICDNRRESKKR